MNPDKIFGRLGNRLFQYAYIFSQFKKGLIPDIFVQDPKYFDEYRNEIRDLFGSPTETIDKVAIHVRRGDYVGNPFYVDLMQTDYYQRAMEYFPFAKFIVFSDDIMWCKEQPIFKECEFFHGTESEDLEKMMKCKGIIMANSSFSWWASYLSNAQVIAPLEWHPDKIIRTNILPEWQTL